MIFLMIPENVLQWRRAFHRLGIQNIPFARILKGCYCCKRLSHEELCNSGPTYEVLWLSVVVLVSCGDLEVHKDDVEANKLKYHSLLCLLFVIHSSGKFGSDEGAHLNETLTSILCFVLSSAESVQNNLFLRFLPPLWGTPQ